jgi:hypothetical protein
VRVANTSGASAGGSGAVAGVAAAAHRAQADALEIEAQAKRRLADEYDAAQERGEVQTRGGDRKTNLPGRKDDPTVSDIGLTYKQVHEARQLRDAEAVDPSVIHRTLDARLADGQEPTKAAWCLSRAADDEVFTRWLPTEAAGLIPW